MMIDMNILLQDIRSEQCAICMDNYLTSDILRQLPCKLVVLLVILCQMVIQCKIIVCRVFKILALVDICFTSYVLTHG